MGLSSRVTSNEKGGASDFYGCDCRQLTTRAISWSAISPDGKFYAYTPKKVNGRAAFGSNRPTLTTICNRAAADGNIIGMAFSPDGQMLYFLRAVLSSPRAGFSKCPSRGVRKSVACR